MPSRTSPGGSLFPYYYKNGELYGAHFGSFHDDEDRLLALMKAEEDFIARQSHPLPVWIDFYENKLSDRILVEFIQSMQRLQRYITRLAIVGCSKKDQRRIKHLEQQLQTELPRPLHYFLDPEVAKTWLVSEGNS